MKNKTKQTYDFNGVISVVEVVAFTIKFTKRTPMVWHV